MPQVKYTGLSAKPKPFLKAKLKSKNVNVDNIDGRMIGYINSLPDDILSDIVVTSGNDGSEHGKNSLHYKNRALDLRFSSKVYEFMLDDPNRIKAGVVLVNPNHGTGKHIHISIPTEEDFKQGYSEHTRDVFINPYSDDAKEYVKGNNLFGDNRSKAVDLGRRSYKGWTYKGGGYDKSAHAVKSDNLVEEGGRIYHDYMPASGVVTNSFNVDAINYMHEQNNLLHDKLSDLIDTINKERDYNRMELENNPNKRVLDARNRFENFTNEVISQLPSLVSGDGRNMSKSTENRLPTPLSAYNVTHFQNSFSVDPV